MQTIHMKWQDLFSMKNENKFGMLSATTFDWYFNAVQAG